MRVTQKEIARQMGINQSTVSYVLGGRAREKKISDELANKIKAFAVRANYEVNLAARSLVTGKSNNIAFFMPAAQGSPKHIWSRTLEGLVEAANAQGYRVMINIMGSDTCEEGARLFKSGSIDGALFYCQDWNILPENLALIDYPCVFMEIGYGREKASASANFDHVDTTSRTGIEEAVAHLHELGHRDVTYIHPLHQPGQSMERLDFACAACQRLGIECRGLLFDLAMVSYTLPVTEQVNHIAAALHDAISPKSPSTAVMGWNDQIAMAVYQVARRKKMRIPERLSVVGYDNFFSEFLYPPLTTIDYQGERLGQRAMKLLLDRIHKRDSGKKKNLYKVPTKLVVRSSTAVPRH